MDPSRTTPTIPRSTPPATAPGRRGGTARALLRGLALVGTFLAVAAASIAFGLQVTPEQPVTALGQTMTVGTASPTLSTAGPGEVVLFGQSLPTRVDFIGPVRPRLVLTDITLDEQVADLFPAGGPTPGELGDQLAGGWRRYFAWEIAFVTVAAIVLLGAIAGWRRYDGRRTIVVLVGGLIFVQAVNLSAIMVTAFTAPGILGQVRSLSELVGRQERPVVPPAEGPVLGTVQAIVMGDSTAAGLGGPPLPDATPEDEACERSTFAFAATLARVNEWNVENLACSGATIASGILGRQLARGDWIRPQLAVAKRVAAPEVVVVSVGANDMRWSGLVRLCAVSDACDDRAQTAYFQRSLDGFTRDYYDLLRQLSTLPGDPVVLINQYYAPFDPDELECLEEEGFTSEKVEVLLDRLRTLNTVLASGAETFGYLTTQPNFAGHELCTDQSYVQGLEDPAPLHPNARGQLVIALAVERALLSAA
jgi:lysophospholipase L1-like esterase